MLELLIVVISILLLSAVVAKILSIEPPSLGHYMPTDAIGCELNHRHLWRQVSTFPELLFPGTIVNQIGIHHCPVCKDDYNNAIPRIDTMERHKHNHD